MNRPAGGRSSRMALCLLLSLWVFCAISPLAFAGGDTIVTKNGPLKLAGEAPIPTALPTAIDDPTPNNVSSSPSSKAPGGSRRMLQACVDQLSFCNSWQQQGYCAPQYVYNGKSVRDVVCARSCNGAPCQRSACSDTLSNCPAWAQQGYCGPTWVYNGKSVRDVVCARSCNGAPCQQNNQPGGNSNGCSDGSTILNSHNSYRAAHGAQPLQWNSGLVNSALNVARNLASRGCVLQHSGGSYGENLYAVYGSTSAQCAPAAKSWYDEIGQYRFTSRPYSDNNFGAVGHFTQVVWKASSQLGCAAATGSNCYVVVCQYTPPGNVRGDSNWLANVAPRSSG